MREFSQVFSGFIAAFFFSFFITFVFGFITPFQLYVGVGVARDDVAIKFWPWLFSCSSTGLKQEFQHSSFVPSCLFYLFSISVSWWSLSRGPILI